MPIFSFEEHQITQHDLPCTRVHWTTELTAALKRHLDGDQAAAGEILSVLKETGTDALYELAIQVGEVGMTIDQYLALIDQMVALDRKG